jgi:hypothetical protein
MTARLLSLAALALASFAEAAPVPFLKPAAPPQAPVELRGSHPNVGLVYSAPPFIGSEAKYRGIVAAWGIKDAPAVDFRTHVLVVAVSEAMMRVHHSVDSRGDLHVSISDLRFKCEAPPDRLNYHLKSFPRRGLRSVNGVAVPSR